MSVPDLGGAPLPGPSAGAGPFSPPAARGAGAPPNLAAALGYVGVGWPVLRLRPGSKVPAEPHGLRDATLDAAEVRRRFADWRGNLGAVVPPGHLVVDLDGEGALRELAARGVSLPATSTQRTPRGLHLVYALPAGVEARQTAGELAPGVDTRAGGRGYLVVEPSVVAGGFYGWQVQLRRELIAEAPAALLAALGSAPCRAARSPASVALRLPESARARVDAQHLLVEGAPQGSRNWMIFRACSALRRIGGTPEQLAAFARAAAARCRPPLPEREALSVAASASRYQPEAGA